MNVNIIIKFQFPSNIHWFEEIKDNNDLLLFSDDNLSISFLNTDTSIDFIKEMTEMHDKSEDSPRKNKFVDKLLRTVIVPELQIIFKNKNMEDNDLPTGIENTIDINTLENSIWGDISNDVKTIYKNLILTFYKVTNESGILALARHDFPVYPYCLNRWEVSVQYDGKELNNLRFSSKDNPYFLDDLTDYVPPIEFIDKNVEIEKYFSYENLIKSNKDLFWEYIFSAQRHFYNNELRSAIIDLDIASSLIVSDAITKYLEITNDQLAVLRKNLSLSDLIELCLVKIESSNDKLAFENIKELHNTRNTILHRYQRRIDDDIFIKSIKTLLELKSNFDEHIDE